MFSTEIDLNYYYFENKSYEENYFNPGISVMFAYFKEKFKFSAGVNYSTKNYYYLNEPSLSYPLEKRDYYLKYLNIPMLVYFPNIPSRKFNFQFFNGLVYNFILDYTIKSYYYNKPTEIENNIDAGQRMGISARVGVNVGFAVSRRFSINLSPFVDYKFWMDHDQNYRPSYENLSENRFLFGARIAFEYVIKKQ
jgi:hypothetical protein